MSQVGEEHWEVQGKGYLLQLSDIIEEGHDEDQESCSKAKEQHHDEEDGRSCHMRYSSSLADP